MTESESKAERRRERAERPEPSGEVKIAPWDALLGEVRRASYRASWIDWVIEGLYAHEGQLDRELLDTAYWETAARTGDPAGDLYRAKRQDLAATRAELRDWVRESRAERSHLVGVSAKAIHAGLNQRIVSQVATEQATILRVLMAALTALDLSASQRETALAAMREAVRAVSLGDGGQEAGRGFLDALGRPGGPVRLLTDHDVSEEDPDSLSVLPY